MWNLEVLVLKLPPCWLIQSGHYSQRAEPWIGIPPPHIPLKRGHVNSVNNPTHSRFLGFWIMKSLSIVLTLLSKGHPSHGVEKTLSSAFSHQWGSDRCSRANCLYSQSKGSQKTSSNSVAQPCTGLWCIKSTAFHLKDHSFLSRLTVSM